MAVIVDAMGGDFAPEEIVRGALDAAREHQIEVHLVGPKNTLGAYDITGLPVTVHHAPHYIEMGESPVRALRKKVDASIRVAARLLKTMPGSAMVSAGSTGAVLAAALMEVGKVGGVDRPAIAAVIPTAKSDCVVLDVGANVDCRPGHLVQFAYLGHAYARYVMGIPSPRVGLLNIGSEAGKGNALSQAAHEMLGTSGLSFAGNIEPDHLFAGEADVIVTDGFAGNILLKASEGVSRLLLTALAASMGKEAATQEGGQAEAPGGPEGQGERRPARGPEEFLAKFSTSNPEHAGAPLLGIDGAVLVTHGATRAVTMRHAVVKAESFARSGAVGAIRGIRVHGASGRG